MLIACSIYAIYLITKRIRTLRVEFSDGHQQYLKQFSRVFTGIYQCLNLIHYALTVFRISYTKPFAGSIQNFHSGSSVVNQFIHHQRDKKIRSSGSPCSSDRSGKS